MTKFQKGDIVEVIKNETDHGFEIGEKVRITKAGHMEYPQAYLAEGVVTQEEWALHVDEIKAQEVTND